jgi:two-component system OmpR family sensor kinase
MGRRTISLSGLVIALVGFGLTRITVTLAAMDSTAQFLFAGIVPLVLGLSLSAFGVILTVGAYDTRLVRAAALWCVVGTVTMAVLALLTLLGSQPEAFTDADEIRRQAYLSNFLIGGAIGGTLTGVYASQNRRHRIDLRQQANRLTLLNRLLRDQVINAATAIKGHADVLENEHNDQSATVIGKQAENVIEIVENVKYLSGTADKSDLTLGEVDLVACVEQELTAIESEYPETTIECSSPDSEVEVRANAQIREVFRHLFENALEYSDAETPRLDVHVEASRNIATVSISDNGPGLPESQQALLERGEIAEFDDPTSGFGLNIVRLLVESFEGEIQTTVTEEGSTIEIELPRTGTGGTAGNPRTLTASGVEPSRLVLSIGAALVAGVTMGVSMSAMGGDVPVIGALYGAREPVVAWITHQFHSIVFTLAYAGILSVMPLTYTKGLARRVVIAVVWSLVLWLFAAGILMPAWLQLVGIEVSLPNVTLFSFVGHLVWGLTVGVLYHAGDGWLDQTARFEDFDPVALLNRI